MEPTTGQLSQLRLTMPRFPYPHRMHQAQNNQHDPVPTSQQDHFRDHCPFGSTGVVHE